MEKKAVVLNNIMHKKNILLIVPTLMFGGQENVAVRTAKIFDKDYNVHMIIFSNEKAAFFPHCILENINVPSQDNKLKKIKNLFCRAKKVKQYKIKNKIMYTYSFGTTANLVNVLAKGNDKILVSTRGSESALKKSLENIIIYKRADRIICVSKDMAIGVGKIFGYKNKIKVLYNPYNYQAIKDMQCMTCDLEMSKNAIITVGRLSECKGYFQLIKAFKMVAEKMDDTQLIFVGDGELHERLEQYTKELGIRNYVKFVGFQENPYSYLTKAKIYFLSSVSEGFPNALVEAMACGLPVIATDCQTGPREILNGSYVEKRNKRENAEYGILVPTIKNESDQLLNIWSDVMIDLLQNDELYNHYSFKSIERAKQFDYDTYLNKFNSIIENL